MTKVDILLVDDRPDGIVALEAILTDPGYNLVVARSGAEALSKVLTHDFAVILMDVQMPDMDGFETVSLIKQREKSCGIPIIFITAINKSDAFISKGYTVGAVDYVVKPFDAHILKSKVSIFVELYKKNRLIHEQSEALREVERRDRMRALNELELEGIRRYRNLADAIPQIVFRSNGVGDIEYFNQYWYLYTGLTLEESAGSGWRSAVYPKSLEEIDRKWLEAASTKAGFSCEIRLRHGQKAEYRWHVLRVVPERSEIANMEGWIGVAADIHDQKTFQDELLLAKKLADTANETKSRFLANMSHEIRTPLGAILGFSELVADAKVNSVQKSDALAAVRRNGQQLLKIIDEILDLSKVESGKLEIELSEFSIVELLNSIKVSTAITAKEKGLDFGIVLNGMIPARIRSNPMRLQQILQNIIGNGIKFTTEGFLIVTVSARVDPLHANSSLHISVKDSGPGLTNAQIEKLFQPFTQGDSSVTRKFGGTGLGLALSRKLARALGGDITIKESLPGEGCNFEITIPIGDVSDADFVDSLDVARPNGIQPTIQDGSQLKGIKILLVEDAPDNRIFISHVLSRQGAEVKTASNGLEGVNMASEGNYDIVLMDIQMPVLDGYGAITQLRQKGFKKPIIALTAHGMLEDRKRSLEVGSNAHITKPIDHKELIEQIGRLSSTFH